MNIKQVLQELHNWAPFNYQESYDNSGLIIGTADQEVQKVLLSIDITEAVMEEAVAGDYDLIISHHPIIFQGIKSLTAKTPEERVVMLAIKNNIAIIAMHTNLDNVLHGVNAMIAQRLGLEKVNILEPKSGLLKKLAVFVPTDHLEKLRTALFAAGAGHIGEYDQCSYGTKGIGTFRGGEQAKPFVGEVGQLHQEKEIKLELIFPVHLQAQISEAIYKNHPYEEPAFDIYSLDNKHEKIGAGVIGELSQDMSTTDFLQFLKEKMKVSCIRHTEIKNKTIKKIALCGGSGSFLIRAAKAAKADVYITGDIKYHEFFDANEHFMIADIGHYESEQFTKELIHDFLIEKFPKFAVQISEHQTNPIKYF
jgi:dinuclear metal center YbgI/SA1388 family protein